MAIISTNFPTYHYKNQIFCILWGGHCSNQVRLSIEEKDIQFQGSIDYIITTSEKNNVTRVWSYLIGVIDGISNWKLSIGW